jgi:hypothetical protein
MVRRSRARREVRPRSVLADTEKRLDSVPCPAREDTVTLLESMISTSVQALVLRDKAFLLNIVRQIESILKGKKFPLVEIAEHPRGVEGVILKALSEITFHNPATIKTVLVALMGDRMKDLDVSSIAPICKVRHDIVHRNGKTIDDEPITLKPEQVYEAMNTIDALASDISRRIFDALNNTNGF